MTQGKEVQIDSDNKMMVSDIPVNLPERVQVVDKKYGKRIGFIDRAEVMKILEDSCFIGFEDTASGEFMVAYSTDPLRRKVVEETENIFDFFRVIKNNLDTVIEADDIIKVKVGVSYVDSQDVNHVLLMPIRCLKSILATDSVFNAELLEAVRGDGTNSDPYSPTERIINYFRENK